MQTQKNEKQTSLLTSLLGKPSLAKASGLTYSLSLVAVVTLSFIFLLLATVFGVTEQEGFYEKDWYLYASYLVTPIAFALVSGYIFRWTNLSWKGECKAQICRPKYYLLAILLQIGLLSLAELNTLFLEFLARFGYVDTPIILPSMDGFGFIGVLFTVAVLPAVFEEIIFRGLLMKGMKSFGSVWTIVISGALFALYHQNPAQTVYQFCCGAAFALVAIRAQSIFPTIVSHFINNALILTLEKFGFSAFPTHGYVTVLSVSAVCLIGSLIWLIFFEKQTFEPFPKGEVGKKERKEFAIFSAVGVAICALTWISALLSGM